MSEIIGFLTANWPYILAYPFAGYTLAKISNKLFSDDTPTKKLSTLQKITRMIFFPINYNDNDWKDRKNSKGDYPNFRFLGDNDYCNLLIFLWPFSSILFAFGLLEVSILIIIKSVIGIVTLIVELSEKSYQLLQSGARQIKLLTPGKNQDIKASIDQIDEFKKTLKLKKGEIGVELEATDSRLCVVNANLESWQIVVRKNADTSAKINPVVKSLTEEVDKLTAKKSNLRELSEGLNTAESNLSGFTEVLWRCLSTITLSIPVIVDGPGLIKQDYLATLAADTISQAETEMSRIKDEINQFGYGDK